MRERHALCSSKVTQSEVLGLSLLIRADASPQIGDGHVVRCLTIADEVRRRGGRAHFVAARLPDRLVQAIKQAGHSASLLGRPDEADDHCGDGWDLSVWSVRRQQVDAAATAAVAEACGATHLLVDHYGLDAVFEAAVGLPVAVLDDLANRPHHAAVLIDHNLGRTAGDYARLAPETATILTGPHHAALRPAFAALRPAALARRKQARPPRRILVSLGSTDVGGHTAPALSAALSVFGDTPIDVVVRPDAPSRLAVETLAASAPAVRIHDHVEDMAALMLECDLAIGASGTSSWERCALGLPTVSLVVAENQRFVAEQLAAADAVAYVGRVTDLEPVLQRLAADPDRLARMSAAAFAVTDGGGAERVVDHLLGPPARAERAELKLRPATARDSERLWLWRNEPATRAVSKARCVIPWHDHAQWLAGVLADSARELLVIEKAGKPVATVRFDRASDEVEVSLTLAPEVRGQGLAFPVLAAACRDYRQRHAGLVLRATIKEGHLASERIFERAGFKPERGASAAGFLRYTAVAASQDDPGQEKSLHVA